MVHSPLHSKHTRPKRLLVIIDANASANPAVEALTLGVTRHTIPVTPTITEESRLKRTESQRFTTTEENQLKFKEQILQVIHPHNQ